MNRVLNDKKAILLFVLPALILFVAIVVIPIMISVYYSLLKWDGFGAKTFIGIRNYIELFVNNQDGFVKSIGNSFIIAFFSVFLQIPLAMILALILARGIKGEGFFRTVYFVPVLLSSVVIGQLWRQIYHPSLGLLNTILVNIGLENWTNTWLGDVNTALIAVLIPTIWQWIGYHMLLLYAGAKAVPVQLREAAVIDGANEFQINTRIIIPLMRPVIRICVIMAVIGSMKAFDLIFVLTGGGPVHATDVPSTLLINTIFAKFRYGYGSSMAIFIVVECLLVTIVIQRLMKSKTSITY